jgi:sporulation protein YlmC with PRC-barrel domain
MEIEQIEQWKGQNVVDCDGEKVGKLEDVYFETGSREAVFGCVKTGMLGRRHFLVPLAGASLSRDHVRVAYQQDQVKDAPQIEPGATLESAMEQELARHYDIELTGSPAGAAPAGGARRYESSSARAEREARAREATERAEELDALADRKAAEAREAELQANDTHRQAQQAQDEHDRAERGATEARAEARAQQPPSP